MDERVRSFDEAEQHVRSLVVNQTDHAARLRLIEKRFDTLDSSVLKRVLFRLDGWGPWYRVRESPRWRPWRRWWTS